MSGQTKKSSNNKKTTNNRTRNNQVKKTPGIENRDIYQEVILWVVLAVSIILFVSNFGIGGKIGNALSGVMFGIFGLLAYVFPILLFVGTVFVLSNKTNKIAVIKVIAAILFVAFLCLFVELVAGSRDFAPGLAFRYGRAHKNGGGWLGGLLAWLIVPNFGRVSAYAIDLIALIITMVIVTERSAWKHVQKGSRRVYETAVEGNERLKEHQEERARLRMEKKVAGVSSDTKLTPTAAGSSDNLIELKADAIDSAKKDGKKTPMAQIADTSSKNVDMPRVQEHHQVNLNPVDSITTAENDIVTMPDSEPMPVFSPQLEELFANASNEVEEVIRTPEPEAEEVYAPEPEQKSNRQIHNASMDEKTAQEQMEVIEQEIKQTQEQKREYVFPPLSLLKPGNAKASGDSKMHLQETALKLQQTLKNFGVNVTISNVSCGPTVTRYEIQPEMGVKVSKIVNLTDDIKLNLAAADIRMEAPIPGKAAIGIEVPNKETVPVMFRDLVESEEFQKHPSNIAFAVGRDIGGQVVTADIAKMPHLLIAGATGSGKSVCINTIIMSLIYKADPEDVKLIMIDPKVVELSVYNGIPHLFIPVVTDPKKAAGALNWAVAEMTERYQKFAEYGVRDLKGYNAKVESIKDIDDPNKPGKLPQLVIIVDELADLMMVAPGDVEDAICRLAQLARACGIHLIIATQRPSVNVITGLIKANMPSRIAFSVTSGVDSRTILDMVGAEKLLGKGDMLFYPQGLNKPLRVQGAFVSDKEVANVVEFVTSNYGSVTYDSSIEEKMSKISEGAQAAATNAGLANDSDGRDAYFIDAAKLLMDKDKASIGMLQRYFKIGFNRAARIMDQLEEAGVVGPEEGTKPRQILMNPETFEALLEDGTF